MHTSWVSYMLPAMASLAVEDTAGVSDIPHKALSFSFLN